MDISLLLLPLVFLEEDDEDAATIEEEEVQLSRLRPRESVKFIGLKFIVSREEGVAIE